MNEQISASVTSPPTSKEAGCLQKGTEAPGRQSLPQRESWPLLDLSDRCEQGSEGGRPNALPRAAETGLRKTLHGPGWGLITAACGLGRTEPGLAMSL